MSILPPQATSGNILIIDDTPANLQVLVAILTHQGYTVRPVLNGRLALQAMALERPDLVLLDIDMPEMNGYEVCRIIQEREDWKEIPLIFLSALNDTPAKVKAFQAGGVDYITKPFQIEEVTARIATQLKNHFLQSQLEKTIQDLDERIRAQVKEISDSQIAAIFAMAKLAESRDDETGKHLDRVRMFCKLLATWLMEQSEYGEQISPAFIENIYHASPLHDIGKVGIPDSIVLKPDRLTPAEFEFMKQHTLLGADTLKAVANQYPHNLMINMGIEIARSHHESWNGHGYPDGLAGEAIPLAARIMAVADVYDALRSKRTYKPALDQEQTCAIIIAGGGTHYDPVVIEAFRDLEDAFSEAYEQMRDRNEIGLFQELFYEQQPTRLDTR